MKVYLVGGAVRDGLLGREVHDRDYVVVGATHEQMIEKGFTCVGASFPVYSIRRPRKNTRLPELNVRLEAVTKVLRPFQP